MIGRDVEEVGEGSLLSGGRFLLSLSYKHSLLAAKVVE